MKCDICSKDNLSLKQCKECPTIFCSSCGLGNDYPLKIEPTQVYSTCPKCGSANFEYLKKTQTTTLSCQSFSDIPRMKDAKDILSRHGSK